MMSTIIERPSNPWGNVIPLGYKFYPGPLFRRRFVSELWSKAKAIPTLDLRFADSKSLTDAVSGQNLIDFTRASGGTYVGSDGLIKNSVVNLLLQSEDFSTAWGRTNILAFGSGSTVDAAMAPDGTATADLITEDTTASALHRILQGSLTLAAGSATCSVYAKRANGERNLEINANALLGGRAVFDLSNGTIGEVSSGTAAIQDVGNGWYRCSITGTSVGTTSTVFYQLCTGTAASTSTYTGDGTSGIYLWGAQLEQSSTVGEYVKTTSSISGAPRFDHDPETGESLGLLVEESRTNLLLHSQDLSNAWWTLSSSTLPSTTESAPDSTTTAVKWVFDSASSTSALTSSNITKAATATTYTFSCWAKPAGYDVFRLYVREAPNNANRAEATFNVTTGSASNVSPFGTFTDASTTITAFPGGWYRCALTFTTGTETSINVRFNRNDALSPNGTDGLILWGAQLEAGSFPTSYIPTTSAAVTRNADVASISGSNFSSWYRADEGTVFASAINPASSCSVLAFSNGTNSNRILLDTISTGVQRRLIVTSGGSSQVSLLAPNTVDVLGLSAAAYKTDDFIISNNGTVSSPDTSGSVPTVDLLYIGSNAFGSIPLNGTIRRLAYFDRRLPDATLQAITKP